VGIVVERSEVKANALEQRIIPSDPPAIFDAAALGRPDGSGRPRRGELPQAIGELVRRELVQVHDDRAIFQASPDELPAIDIRIL
jgi:hypothetical protein